MVAANGRDIVTAVVEVVAFYITVAARVSLAVVSCTASIICCTACSLVSGWAIVGLVELVLYLFGLLITPTSPTCRIEKEKKERPEITLL